MKIKINGVDKDITIKSIYTRGVDKEFNKILLKDSANVNSSGEVNFVVNPSNLQDANDYLVKEMAGLTEKEIGEMEAKDYDAILKEINAVKTPNVEKKNKL